MSERDVKAVRRLSTGMGLFAMAVVAIALFAVSSVEVGVMGGFILGWFACGFCNARRWFNPKRGGSE